MRMMSKPRKIDSLTKDTLSTATDIFTTGNRYTELMGGDLVQIVQIPASESGSQKYIFRPSSEHYIDPLSPFMTLKVKVVKADGSGLPAVTNLNIIPEDSFCTNL